MLYNIINYNIVKGVADLVQFKALANKGRIRNIIMASGVTVNVYEPTAEQIDKILDLQENWVDADDPNSRSISGVDIIRDLFPILTDLEGIEDMTNEEIQEVADNPTIAYVQLQTEIETVLTEIYKTHILSARKKLLETDYHVEANKTNVETFNRSVALAVKNTGTTDLIDKIDNYIDAADKASEAKMEADTNDRIIHLNNVKEEVQKDIDTQNDKNQYLAKYKNAFNKLENKDISGKDDKRN